MALTYQELEAITNDYFLADNKQAVDIYFNESFLLNYFLKQQKGLWERPDGGIKIRVPIEYDGQIADFYSKGDTLTETDRENINVALFDWKHAYANAKIFRIDQLKNNGAYAEVQLVTQRISSAQKSLTKLLASSLYDDENVGDPKRLTGLLALTNPVTTVPYGGIIPDDLVAVDGSKNWIGRRITTAENLSLNVIRTMCSTAKVRDGIGGKPDLVVTTEELWNVVADILQAQQRFTDGKETAKAGFTGLYFEGKDIFPDDYCPAGTALALNSNYLGFVVHKEGYFMRTQWEKIPASPEDKTMKIYFDGNFVTNNRKAHIEHRNLS